MATAIDMTIYIAVNIERAIFSYTRDIIVGTLYAHYNELFPPAVKKLLQSKRLSEGGIIIEEEVMAVEHIQYGITLLRRVVVVRKI